MNRYRAQREGRRLQNEIILTVTLTTETWGMTISSEGAAEEFTND
jgi:hypothetical protein